MSDDKSYRLNLDKSKGHQIELLDETDIMTVNSTKSKRSQKSTGTRQTIKLKNRSKDNPERPKEWDQEINRSAMLHDIDLIGNEETKQQVAVILEQQEERRTKENKVRESIKQSGILERQAKENKVRESAKQSGILERQAKENKVRESIKQATELVMDPIRTTLPPSPVYEREDISDSIRVDDSTVFDLPPPPNHRPSPKPSIDRGDRKGIRSISCEINAINQKLDYIPEENDADVRTNSSTKMMNFAPALPMKQPIDSYSRVDLDIGANLGLGSEYSPVTPSLPKRQLTGRELHAELTKELLKIERLKKRGYQPSRMFTIIDKLEDVRAERARLEEIASLESSIQMQKNGLRFVSSIFEMANSQYNNLFDLNLNGWSDSLNDNIDSYEPIFEELHDKYKDSVQMAPELKLIMMFVGSAVSFHFTQQVLKKAEKDIPGIGAIMEQNPRLKKEVTDTAARMVAQNMMANNNNAGGGNGGGGAGDLLGGLFGGGGGNILSGLFGGNSQPAPVSNVVGTRANNVQLKEPDGIDNLLGSEFNQGMLSEATLRVDDDLTSHITGSGPKNVIIGNTRRAVKKRI